MLRVAVSTPVVCGVNVTLNVQLELAGTLGWQVLVWLKFGPALLMMFTLLMVIAVEPAFWNVTVIGALLVPTVVPGKLNVVGVTATAVALAVMTVPARPAVKLPE